MAKDNQYRQSLELNDDIAFEEADVLPGHPGYRTRKGRSGYDYIDTQLEFAYMQGVFLRRFFTLSFKTRHPVLHVFLIVMALFCLFPLLFAIVQTVNHNPYNWYYWILAIPISIPGFFALANVIKNLFRKE